VDALHARGLETTGTDGINVWLRVGDEDFARRRLAKAGIGISIGSPFELSPSGTAHIRLTCAAVEHGLDELADHLAAAAAGSRAVPTRGVA
jgi:aspartate/methionine/tyrosine aminotransferase